MRTLRLIGILSLIHCVLCDDLLFVAEFATPGFYYPKFEVFDWSKGKASYLTSAGLRQHYLLGRELRKRYIEDAKLLGERYIERSQIKVRTTSDLQTISSAQAQLMGLYTLGSGDLLRHNELSRAAPPNAFDYSPWTDELERAALNYTYQAIPIEQHGKAPDLLLDSEQACTSVKRSINDKLKQNQGNYRSLFNTIADAVGVDRDTIGNVSYAADLRYALMISLIEGRPAKENAESIYSETVELEKASSYVHVLDVPSAEKTIAKLITTPLLKEIANLTTEIAQNHALGASQNSLRFALYISELHLFLALLQQFKFETDLKTPTAAAVLLLELYKNTSEEDRTLGDYYVKLEYSGVSKEVKLPLFTEDLKNSTFADDKFQTYCYGRPDEEPSAFNWIIFFCVAGGVVLIGLLGLGMYLIKTKCTREINDSDAEDALMKVLQEKFNTNRSSDADSKSKGKTRGKINISNDMND